MRYLITGAGGQLALEFIKRLPSDKTFAFKHSELDIGNEKSLSQCLDYVKPAVIINCAAYNLVDKAETDYENAYRTNAAALKYIANLSKKYNAKVIHFSTDYVFGGDKTVPYTEKDDTNPINKYGLSKLEGEKNLISNAENYLLFRVSWVYGYGKQNFIYKLISWLKEKKDIAVSTDEVSVPCSTQFIVDVVIKSLQMDLCGLWHLVPLGLASRFEWAVKILKFLNIKADIKEAKQSDFNLAAKRPHFSAMSSQALARELGVSFSDWEKYLYDFLKKNSFKEIL